ncbi:MAG: hypothetical protein ACOX67_06700, partial [Oscillospiraceae bacterium]
RSNGPQPKQDKNNHNDTKCNQYSHKQQRSLFIFPNTSYTIICYVLFFNAETGKIEKSLCLKDREEQK